MPRLLQPATLVFLCAAVVAAGAAAPAGGAEAQPQTLDVWPGAAPGEKGKAAPEQVEHSRPGQPKYVKVTNVSKPTLTVYRPAKDKNTGAAIIVCPGGGYSALMMDYEGEDVARWLNTLGVTGVVLKYRVPARPGVPRYLPALQDAQRALSIVRGRAREWDVDPGRVGMLGFSAGGHLTAAAGTNFDKRAYDDVDAIDKVPCRPDFAVVVYPGGLLAKGKEPALSPEIRVDGRTPPTFIVQAHDDRVNSENSVYLYLALKRANVPAELHVYASGGHGFGIRPGDKPHATWPQRCAEWMRDIGVLKGRGG
jgi:acetyl esterase/lipase